MKNLAVKDVNMISRWAGLTLVLLFGMVSLGSAESESTEPDTFNRLVGVDLFGDDLTSNGVKGISLTECEAICSKDSSCKAYSFIEAKQWCFPKHGSGNQKDNTDIMSGVKADLNDGFECSDDTPEVVKLAREYTCLYEQDVGYPYKQWWNVVHLLPTASWNFGGDTNTVYVHGDGKSGDFFGTLKINCPLKSASWITVAGWIPVARVPNEVYRRLGLAYCGTGITLTSLDILWD